MAALYGQGGLADGAGYGSLDRADWGTGGPADGADYKILDGAD